MQLTAEITELATCGCVTFSCISVLCHAVTDDSEEWMKVVTDAVLC